MSAFAAMERRALIRAVVALGTLVALTGRVAHAQAVVYDGGAPNGEGGWNYAAGQVEAERVTLADTRSFDAVRFWTIVSTGQALTNDALTWTLWSDAGDRPGVALSTGRATPLHTLRGPAGPPSAFLTSYQTDFVLPTQTLVGGTYWLSIASESLLNVFWETTDARDRTSALGTLHGAWTPTTADLALQFRATGAPVLVPEPLPAVLQGLALLLVIADARAGWTARRLMRDRRREHTGPCALPPGRPHSPRRRWPTRAG